MHSDIANFMKVAKSGVQKLIKTKFPKVFDVGCICNSDDLTIEASMKILSVDIDQLLVDVFFS